MTVRTQVGIVGAGPAGLRLPHLLALRGIYSIVVENRSRAYCEARQRAGLLEAGTTELLRAVGLGKRMDAEGLEHGGIYLQFAGERHHLDFKELTGWRPRPSLSSRSPTPRSPTSTRIGPCCVTPTPPGPGTRSPARRSPAATD